MQIVERHLRQSVANKPFLTFSVDSFTHWLTDDDLYSAVIKNKDQSLRFLLARNELSLYGRNMELLSYALQCRSTEIVQILLNDPRVDPSAKDNEAIIYAAANGRPQ